MEYEPQAKECSLAFVKALKFDSEFGKEATKFVSKLALDKVCDAIVVHQ
jgi:hypothetical protein